MATRIKLSEIEQSILDRVFLSPEGFERVEDLLAAIGVDRTQFVDALENLEGEGYLSVSSYGGSLVVASEDPVGILIRDAPARGMIYSQRVADC